MSQDRSDDEARREAIAALQAAITEGVLSGEAEPFDMAEFQRAMRERHRTRRRHSFAARSARSRSA